MAQAADRKDKEYKKQAGMFDHERPEQPVIAYLAAQQEELGDEETKNAAEETKV